jgi:hypothetical protein
MVYKALKLPLSFDPESLKADLTRVVDPEWVTHFNTGYHDGGWSGVALRSAAGRGESLFPVPGEENFVDTALLGCCPHFMDVLASLHFPLRSVRLLRLRAGSVIREHCDYDLGFESGEVRLHIPIVTNPGVEFYLDGKRVVMGEGETWYTNVNLPHRVQNLGKTDRIHLVIDGKVNDWVAQLFAAGEPAPEVPSTVPPMISAAGGLREFQQAVWADESLQNQFWNVEDTSLFIRLVREAALARGFHFTEEDVRSEMQVSRKAWLERETVA